MDRSSLMRLVMRTCTEDSVFTDMRRLCVIIWPPLVFTFKFKIFTQFFSSSSWILISTLQLTPTLRTLHHSSSASLAAQVYLLQVEWMLIAVLLLDHFFWYFVALPFSSVWCSFSSARSKSTLPSPSEYLPSWASKQVGKECIPSFLSSSKKLTSSS